jgi:hypothetical protein
LDLFLFVKPQLNSADKNPLDVQLPIEYEHVGELAGFKTAD